IDFSHAAGAELDAQLVGADPPLPRRISLLIGKQPGGDLQGRRFNETFRLRLARQQRLDLPPQRLVACAGLIKERVQPARVTLESRRIELLDLFPTLSPHLSVLFSVRGGAKP